MKKIVFAFAAGLLALPVLAKLPAPSDEAKAKAAEAAAKTAHAGKVDNYKLCLSMDKAAAHYFKTAAAKKEVKPAVATPACADPGPFVPPVAAAPAAPVNAAAASAPAPAAAPAAPAAKDGAKKS